MTGAHYSVHINNQNRGQDGDPTDTEIFPVPGLAHRIFVVLDFSDSCTGVGQTLEQANWVWQSLPPQWQATIFAISVSEPLHPRAESMYVRDLGSFLSEVVATSLWDDWRARYRNRGSFLQPTLECIADMLTSENAIDGTNPSHAALVILTDGELLDPDPLVLPPNTKCMGILCKAREEITLTQGTPYAQFPLFTPESLELKSYLAQLVAPGSKSCEIVASIPVQVKGNDTPRVRAGVSFNWDFTKRPLLLSVPSAVIRKPDAYIEVRADAGTVSRLTLDGLATGHALLPELDLPSASLGNRLLTLVDDDSVVAQLLHALRSRAAKGLALDAPGEAVLKAVFGAHATIENAIAVVVSHCSSDSVDQSHTEDGPMPFTLLLGKLYKDPTRPFFMKGLATALSDPGASPKSDLLIKYDDNDARWYLVHGSSKRTLAPRAGVPLSGIFFDTNGIECEAFICGPISK